MTRSLANEIMSKIESIDEEASAEIKGFIREALRDESCNIRLKAYRVLGFTKDALNDEDNLIIK